MNGSIDGQTALNESGNALSISLEDAYDRYAGLAFSVAFRMLGDVPSAEDAVQESFLSVWRHAESYHVGRGSVESWLIQIVRHRCIDILRGRQARPSTVQIKERHEFLADADVWNDVAQRLTGEQIRQSLGQLPGVQRETIELAYFGGCSCREIAMRMGIPVGTVKGRMRLALRKLHEILGNTRLEEDRFLPVVPPVLAPRQA